MSTIAEWAPRGSTAAAEGDRLFASQIKRISGRIRDGDRAGYEQRAVITNSDFDIRHLQDFLSSERGALRNAMRAAWSAVETRLSDTRKQMNRDCDDIGRGQ